MLSMSVRVVEGLVMREVPSCIPLSDFLSNDCIVHRSILAYLDDPLPVFQEPSALLNIIESHSALTPVKASSQIRRSQDGAQQPRKNATLSEI